MRHYIVKAIAKLKPNSEYAFTDNDYSTIEWFVLEGKAPTQAEIDTAIIEVQADEAAEAQTRAEAKAALLARLGITEDEARLLLGGN